MFVEEISEIHAQQRKENLYLHQKKIKDFSKAQEKSARMLGRILFCDGKDISLY